MTAPAGLLGSYSMLGVAAVAVETRQSQDGKQETCSCPSSGGAPINEPGRRQPRPHVEPFKGWSAGIEKLSRSSGSSLAA